MNFNFISELKKIGLGLIYLALILLIIGYFHLNTWGIIILLTLSSIIISAYSTIKNKTPFKITMIIKTFLIITILIHFMHWLGGFAGFLITTLTLSGLILWRKWPEYVTAKEKVETMIFGKPLKEFKAGGVKPPKIKIKF